MNETGWRYPTDGEACTLTLAQFLKGEVRRGAKKPRLLVLVRLRQLITFLIVKILA